MARFVDVCLQATKVEHRNDAEEGDMRRAVIAFALLGAVLLLLALSLTPAQEQRTRWHTEYHGIRM